MDAEKYFSELLIIVMKSRTFRNLRMTNVESLKTNIAEKSDLAWFQIFFCLKKNP